METITTRHIQADELGKYIKVPFEVPQNVERVDISYSYSRAQGNTIDFALCRGNLHIGAAGSNRSSFWLSEYCSSAGFNQMELTPGEYHIILGAYKVAPEGVDVECKITFTFKSLQLLKGDLHAHTTASDGVLSVSQLISLAKTSKLDFLCITDHNNEAPYIPPSDRELTVIPGVEWTPLYKGHANFIGARGALKMPYHHVETPEQVRQIFKLAQGASALVSLNHPMCNNCGWHWGFDMEYDLFEIWNGPPQITNLKATEFWHRQLCEGKKITAVGGSDFHRHTPLGALGSPTTWVYANSRGETDILNAIKNGRAFVTFSTEGPTIQINCGDSIMGDTVAFDEGKPITFAFDNLREGDVITIYHDSGVAKTMTACTKPGITLDIEMGRHMFYRADVVRRLADGIPPMPVLISNPVYIAG